MDVTGDTMKIFDCFTFFNEIDLLKFRIELLYPAVDYFVIVECSKTQTGNDKPYNFLEHEKEFSKWKDKIKYFKADTPPSLDEANGENWAIENYQRNYILTGLVTLNPQNDDIILISDLDEIVNPSVISHFNDYNVAVVNEGLNLKAKIKKSISFLMNHKKLTFNSSLLSVLEYSPVVLRQDFFYYYMNCRCNTKWNGSVMFFFKNIQLPQKLRNMRNELPNVMGRGGWHFSYLGGPEKIITKIRNLVEGHLLKIPEGYTIEEYISYCINNAIDIYHAKGNKYSYINPNEIGLPEIEYFIKQYTLFFNTERTN